MMRELYVEGCLSQCSTRVLCPLTTSPVLFLAQYCHTSSFRIVFVDEADRKGGDRAFCCSYVLKDLTDLEFSFAKWDELPGPVRNVSLPSVYQSEVSLVRSGLCVLLRHVVKEAHTARPDLNLVDLLGFRQGSMKMCAEVSGWTKLCEVDLATSVSDLIGQLKCVSDDAEEPSAVQDGRHIPLPLDLLKLESHFCKKCRIHNEKHRQRLELVRLRRCLNQLGLPDSTNCSYSRQREPQTYTVKEKTDPPSLASPHQYLSGDLEERKDLNNSDGDIECVLLGGERLLIEHCMSLHHGVRKFKVDKKLGTCSKSGSNEKKNMSGASLSDRRDTNQSNDSPAVSSSVEIRLDKLCLNNDARLSDSPQPKTLQSAIKDLTFHDIEFIHLYSEGAEITIADLILLTYIYHLVAGLGFTCGPLKGHLPNILRWAAHLTSLGPMVAAGVRLGWSMDRFVAALRRGQSECTALENGLSGRVVFDHDGSPCVDENEMELSRCDKMKYKAIQPRVEETLHKLEMSGIVPKTGSHPRGEEVEVDWTNLPSGVHPKEGNVPEKRTQRKCQQLENLATAVQSIAKPGDIIVDFCSGGGHLGIVLAYLLPNCQVYLVENKEESLLKACARLSDLNLTNVTLYQCNLDYFRGLFQVGVCLHACGSATDMVLQLCLDARAGFVICPCCYGSIRETHLLTYPRSDAFLSSCVSYQDFLTLGHAADQTEFNIALETQGRRCMNLVDTDRGEFARQHSYLVTLCSLQPLTCSPKNNLLIGTPCQI